MDETGKQDYTDKDSNESTVSKSKPSDSIDSSNYKNKEEQKDKPETVTTTTSEANNKSARASGSSENQLYINIKSAVSRGLKHKRLLVGSSIFFLALAAIVVVIFFMIPEKANYVVTNLQNYYFASTNYAVGNEADTILEGYYAQVVAPALVKGNCANYISENCKTTAPATGTNPVTNLYHYWAGAKIENTLAEQYGIEISYNSSNGNLYLVAPGIANPTGAVINQPGSTTIDSSLYADADQGNVQQNIINGLNSITDWQAVMNRYIVDRYLEEQFGVVRCVINCGQSSTVQDFASLPDNVAQSLIAEIIIQTRSNIINDIIIPCIKAYPPAIPCTFCEPDCPYLPSSSGELNDEMENPYTDVAVQSALEAAANSYEPDTKAAQSAYSEYGTIAPVPDTAFGQDNSVGEKLSYLANATIAADFYMLYRTYTEEIHTEYSNAQNLGDFVDSLGPGDNSQGQLPEYGGTATAESVPLYTALISDGDPATKTAGQSGGTDPYYSNDYQCASGQLIDLVCTEEILGGQNALEDIPDPFGVNMSGGRTFDMLAAGADVAANGFAHIGIGGKELNSPEHQQIIAAEDNSDITNAPATDPFEIPQYGYTPSDLAAIGNPLKYWNKECSDGVDGTTTYQWAIASTATLDPTIGEPANYSTDPCLLINTTASSLGGIFSASMLSADDLADSSNGSTTTSADKLSPSEMQALSEYPDWTDSKSE